MNRLPIAGLLGLASLSAHAQTPQLMLHRSLESVVVTATRALTENITTLRDTVVITGEELRADGPLTLAEVLQKRAGVEIRSTGGPGQPTSIFLRGAGAAQTLVLVDGLRVGSATAGTTALESIPLEMIERIEVVKGALSSLYGSEAIGGVVQIFTRGKSLPHLFATAAYGNDNDRRASAGLATADQTTHASISLGARKVDAPSATNPRAPFGVHDPDRDPHENAFATLRVSQRMWQGETLALEAFGTRSRTFYDGGSPDDRSDQKVFGGRITSSTEVRPGWASHLSVGHSRDELSFEGPFPARFETRQDQAAWIHDLATPAGSLVAGAEFVRQRVLPQANEAGEPIYLRDRRETKSAFASWNETWRGQRVEASVRRDDNSQFGYGRYSGAPTRLADAPFAIPQLDIPAFYVVALFLLAYIVVLVPVNYFVLKAKDKKEYAWLTTPAIVLVFSFGAYLIGYGFKGGRTLVVKAGLIRIGGSSSPSAAASSSSAWVRSRRLRSRRRLSWASASFAFRSASSRRRRLSPRSAALTSTWAPRRSDSASPSSAVPPANSGPTTTSGGTAGDAS